MATKASRKKSAGKRGRRFKPSDYSGQEQKPIKLKSTLRSDWEASGSGTKKTRRKVATRKKKPSATRSAGSQWVIKGVSDETREASRSAAKAAGLPLGEWLDSALTRAQTGSDDGRMTGVLIELERRLSALESRRSFWDRLADLVSRARS